MASAYTQMNRLAKSGLGCVSVAASRPPIMSRVIIVTGQMGAMRHTAFTVAQRSRRAFAFIASLCDSPRNRDAKAMLSRQSPAAINPGAARPPARALNDARHEEEPERVRVCEDDVRDRRRGESDDERGLAPIAVGNAPPEW